MLLPDSGLGGAFGQRGVGAERYVGGGRNVRAACTPHPLTHFHTYDWRGIHPGTRGKSRAQRTAVWERMV